MVCRGVTPKMVSAITAGTNAPKSFGGLIHPLITFCTWTGLTDQNTGECCTSLHRLHLSHQAAFFTLVALLAADGTHCTYGNMGVGHVSDLEFWVRRPFPCLRLLFAIRQLT